MWKEPKATIAAAFESPNMVVSLGVFVLPYLISLALMLVFGVVINPGVFAINVVRELIVFALIAVVLAVIASKTSRVKNLFSRCFSVLVLSRMITALLYVLMALFLVLNPSVTPQIVSWLQGEQTSAEVIAQISSIDSIILDVSVWVFLLIFFFFSIWIIYVQFLAVKEAVEGSIGKQVLVLAVLFVAGFLIDFVLQFAVAYLLLSL